MGSNPCREIQLLGIAHLVVGKTFQIPEVRRATKFIRGLRGGVEARLGLILYHVNLGWKTHFCIV